MADAFKNVTGTPYDTDGILYKEASEQRFVGHDKVVYGFVLQMNNNKEVTFIFPLNPQSIEQDEEGAVVITPTQGGGKFIENQGSLMKDIVITGTTGFLPTKAMKSDPTAL